MKVLVLGSGAREHAIAWKFASSKRISGLFIAPGNAGTEELGTNLPDVDPSNAKEVIKACKANGIDYVFVGPEVPLAAGVIDELRNEGLGTFGPHKAAAMLEASKIFSKQFMKKHNIPTAASEEFDNYRKYKEYIKSLNGTKVVIKKSGLAAGKGVFESADKNDLIDFGKSVLKEDNLLVEEFLTGYEISVFCISDGKDFIILPTCADFKKALDKDLGPNTGGMGAICPVPNVTLAMMEEIKKTVIIPTYDGLKKDNLMYKGLLYFGLMMTEKGPKLLEYNVRFGDPETQPLMNLIESDFVDFCDAIEQGQLAQFPLVVANKFALGVVVAAEGYPGKYKKDCVVRKLPDAIPGKLSIFHASTYKDSRGRLLTTGGRCFTIVGVGESFTEAAQIAYEGVSQIDYDGAMFRTDIGKKFFAD